MAERDLLERTTDEMRSRVKELEPLVREHDRLQRAIEALQSITDEQRPRGRAGRRTTRGRASDTSRRRTGSGRARRGERRQQLLRVLQAEPGRRPSEAAHLMGINPSQLHSLAHRMEEEGDIERKEGGLYLVSSEGARGSEPPDAA